MRPNTRESGIFSTERSKPVRTNMLTRILVPKPKNAFQSPEVQREGPRAGWVASFMVLPLAGRAKFMCSGVAALPLPRMTSRIVRPARRTKCASTGRVTEAPEPIIVQRLATPEVEADAQHLLSRFRLRPHPSTGRELLTKGRISLAASHA